MVQILVESCSADMRTFMRNLLNQYLNFINVHVLYYVDP